MAKTKEAIKNEYLPIPAVIESIIEGTSVLRFIKPDLNIHVYGKGKFSIC